MASASATMRAQSAAAEGGRNESGRKTPEGVFLLILFAREARRTAPEVGAGRTGGNKVFASRILS